MRSQDVVNDKGSQGQKLKLVSDPISGEKKCWSLLIEEGLGIYKMGKNNKDLRQCFPPWERRSYLRNLGTLVRKRKWKSHA